VAGHSRPATLRPYLNLVVKRHFETDEAQWKANEVARDLSRTRRLQDQIRKLLTSDRLRYDVEAAAGPESAAHVLDLLRGHFARLEG
jgi:hypothetical protein